MYFLSIKYQVLTDGNKITAQSGVLDQLNLPMHSLVPGSELTKEPFRWDQRIFSLVLRMAGTLPPANVSEGVPPPDLGNPLNDMCEVTGGRSYSITSQRQLIMAIENLVQSVQPGVVINFEKFGPDPPPPVGQTVSSSLVDSKTKHRYNIDIFWHVYVIRKTSE